jgi:hypothetical protein
MSTTHNLAERPVAAASRSQVGNSGRQWRHPFTREMLLLRGHPGEILPDELERVLGWARSYVGDSSHPEAARERVSDVWLRGVYRPAHLKRRSTTGPT